MITPKIAVTHVLFVNVNAQVLLGPVHAAPIHSQNTAPVAVSVIGVPAGNVNVQALPQLMPAGMLDTIPGPPVRATVSVTSFGALSTELSGVEPSALPSTDGELPSPPLLAASASPSAVPIASVAGGASTVASTAAALPSANDSEPSLPPLPRSGVDGAPSPAQLAVNNANSTSAMRTDMALA